MWISFPLDPYISKLVVKAKRVGRRVVIERIRWLISKRRGGRSTEDDSSEGHVSGLLTLVGTGDNGWIGRRCCVIPYSKIEEWGCSPWLARMITARDSDDVVRRHCQITQHVRWGLLACCSVILVLKRCGWCSFAWWLPRRCCGGCGWQMHLVGVALDRCRTEGRMERQRVDVLVDCWVEGMMEWWGGRDADAAAQPPINNARKMPSAEGTLDALARALVIEAKKLWKNVFKGSNE